MTYEYVTKIKFAKTTLQKKAISDAIELRELGLKISKDNIFLTISSKIFNHKNWGDIKILSKQIRSVAKCIESTNPVNQNK